MLKLEYLHGALRVPHLVHFVYVPYKSASDVTNTGIGIKMPITLKYRTLLNCLQPKHVFVWPEPRSRRN
jgi:hypothetical protein